MKRTKNHRLMGLLVAVAAAALILLVAGLALKREAKASGDLDEILAYSITVDVNDDATLKMVYHIEWKVLDSDSEGPLEWVKIGIPNKHYVSYKALTSTISSIDYMYDHGTYLRIDLDRKYYAGSIVVFEFELQQDYMYEMNQLTEGETVYWFTPGWFDDCKVDQLTVKWNSDKAESWDPACEVEDGYCVWSTKLAKGGRYTVSVTYKNDAFAFDTEKVISKSGGFDGESDDDIVDVILGSVLQRSKFRHNDGEEDHTHEDRVLSFVSRVRRGTPRGQGQL